MRQVLIYPGESGYFVAEVSVYRAVFRKVEPVKKHSSTSAKPSTYLLRYCKRMAILYLMILA